jgi:hypothetical protein
LVTKLKEENSIVNLKYPGYLEYYKVTFMPKDLSLGRGDQGSLAGGVE